MVGVDATAIVTGVQHEQSIGDNSVGDFPSYAVRPAILAVDLEGTVSAVKAAERPLPTITTSVNLTPEAFNGIHSTIVPFPRQYSNCRVSSRGLR